MSWEKKPNGPGARGRTIEGTLRHPDGSPDIAAYGKIAHRQREAAILSAVRETADRLRAISSVIWRVLGRSGPFDRMRPSEARLPRSGSCSS